MQPKQIFTITLQTLLKAVPSALLTTAFSGVVFFTLMQMQLETLNRRIDDVNTRVIDMRDQLQREMEYRTSKVSEDLTSGEPSEFAEVVDEAFDGKQYIVRSEPSGDRFLNISHAGEAFVPLARFNPVSRELSYRFNEYYYNEDGEPSFPVFINPVGGEFRRTSDYGMRFGAMFTGVNFAAPQGTPILAVASGEVTHAGESNGRLAGLGSWVELQHANGVVTQYGHLSSINVHEGQSVEQGEVLGGMGYTGNATGTVLTFYINVEGTNRHPKEFIPYSPHIPPPVLEGARLNQFKALLEESDLPRLAMEALASDHW